MGCFRELRMLECCMWIRVRYVSSKGAPFRILSANTLRVLIVLQQFLRYIYSWSPCACELRIFLWGRYSPIEKLQKCLEAGFSAYYMPLRYFGWRCLLEGDVWVVAHNGFGWQNSGGRREGAVPSLGRQCTAFRLSVHFVNAHSIEVFRCEVFEY